MTQSALPPLRRQTLIQVDRLDFGTFDVGPGRRRIPLTGFLLTTDGGTRLLFDTGFPPAYARSERAAALADGLDAFGRLERFETRHTAEGALALQGLTPADVSHVILSHGHIDHVGSLALFAHATIHLTAVERAEPFPLYFGKARPIPWPEARYAPITRARDLAKGLRLIPTPGHTPGHLSVLAQLPSGKALVLAADAINRHSEPAEGYPDAMDPVAAARSGTALLGLARRIGAQVIPGHEPADIGTAITSWR